MEKTLKKYKDEVLAVMLGEINRCHEGYGKSLANRATVVAGVFEEVRNNLINLRETVSKIPLEEMMATGLNQDESVEKEINLNRG